MRLHCCTTEAGADDRAHIHLCGALAAEIGGRRVERSLPGPKGRQLFACLVLSRRRPISRDRLIDVIWHDKPPATPDAAFSTLLTRLRAAVGPDLVVGRHELAIDLGDDPWVDWEVAHDNLAAAEARLAARDAAGALSIASEALGIARGELLPGLSTPWIEQRRRELADTTSALLEVAARAALSLAGEHLPAAERHARELIAREPYRESGHQLLMQAHAARGNIAEALRVYDDVRTLLREELGIAPAAQLRALADGLLQQDGDGTGPPAAAERPAPAPSLPPAVAAAAGGPLVGRLHELDRLMSAVLDMPADRCRVIALCGEAGIGKARLAAEVAARAHAEGCEILHGRAQRVSALPYQPFVEALRRRLRRGDGPERELLPLLEPELAELARVVPELRRAVAAAPDHEPADADLAQQRICDAVAALLGALAARRPLLIVIEDLHWADASTRLLLRHTARALDGTRATILATLRDDVPLDFELRVLLTDLLRERALERLPLRPLDEEETEELIAAHRGACPADQLQLVRIQAGGNPFLIEQALHGDWLRSPAPWDPIDPRLDRASPPARDLLGARRSPGRGRIRLAGRARAPRVRELTLCGAEADAG